MGSRVRGFEGSRVRGFEGSRIKKGPAGAGPVSGVGVAVQLTFCCLFNRQAEIVRVDHILIF